MSLDPLERLIAAEREHPATPTTRQAKAVWHRVQNSLAIGVMPIVDLPSLELSSPMTAATGPAAKIGAWFSTTAAKVTLVVTVAGTTTATVAAITQPRERGDASRAVAVAEAHPRVPASAPRDAPTPTIDVDGPPVEQAAPIAVHEPVTETRKGAAREARKLRARTARVVTTPTMAEPPTPTAPSPSEEGSAEELALIKRAQAAFRRGSMEQTLTLADQHAARFPGGALAEDREALRILAQCRRGRHDEAVRAREAFVARWPDSLHERRLNAVCR